MITFIAVKGKHCRAISVVKWYIFCLLITMWMVRKWNLRGLNKEYSDSFWVYLYSIISCITSTLEGYAKNISHLTYDILLVTIGVPMQMCLLTHLDKLRTLCVNGNTSCFPRDRYMYRKSLHFVYSAKGNRDSSFKPRWITCAINPLLSANRVDWQHDWQRPASQRHRIITHDTPNHNNDAIMNAMASQITSLAIVYSTVYSSGDQRKHQSSSSLDFVRGIHRWAVNSPHKGPVTRKMFPFDDVIMSWLFQLSARTFTLISDISHVW